MKIDIFTHVMLPKYKQRLYKYAEKFETERKVQDRRPILTDSEARLRKLGEFEDTVQVLSTREHCRSHRQDPFGRSS